MRISTSTMYEAGIARMSDQQANLVKTQQQISSNRRILTPADDPVGAARALELSQGQSVNAQFGINRQNAKTSLSQEEGVLQSVTGLIQDLKVAVVQSGNPVLDDSQRKIIATDLKNRFDELMALANSRDAIGNFLFSGYQNTTQPFTQSATGVRYAGDQGQTMLQVDTARQMATNNTGDAIFENIPSSGTFGMATAATNTGSATVSPLSVADARLLTGHNYDLVFQPFALPPTISAAAANTGTGTMSAVSLVAPGTPTGNTYEMVFSVAAGVTTYSVFDTTLDPGKTGTPATTGTYTAPTTITFDSLAVTVNGAPADTDTLSIQPNTDSGTFSAAAATNTGTAAISPLKLIPPGTPTGNNYDIVFSVAGGVTSYSVFDITLDPTKGGTPATTGTYTTPQTITFDSLQVTTSGVPNNGDTMTVRPSSGTGTYAVFDITLDPSKSGVPVTTGAQSSPQTISFDGLQVTVSGTPAANDTATVRPNAKQSLFTTMNDLITLLQAPGSGPLGGANLKHGLANANNNVDSALDSVLAIRASVGSRLKELDTLDSAGDGKNIQYAESLSAIQDLDYNKAISDLMQQQMVLEASQKSFMKISGLSLFNLL